MPHTEVLAVEIKQFSGEKGQTLVPRVIGRIASSPDRSSKKRGSKTVAEILGQMPNLGVLQAGQRLVDVAKEHGGIVTPGSIALSIRCVSLEWPNPLSIAWINPIPNYSGWMGTREFTFGMENYALENKPPGLVAILKGWAAQFKDDSFATEYPFEGLDAWIVSHENAVNHIDLLADRLKKVFNEVKSFHSAS